MAGETDEQRTQKAENLAYKRGQAEAEINSRFDQLERHSKEINGSIAESAKRLAGVEAATIRIEKAQAVAEAASHAAKEAAAEAANAQVSTRTFLLGLGGLVLATVTPIVALVVSQL